MANHASHAALPYPIKGARFTVLIPYLDADGDPTDPTTPDTEISEDDAAATDTAEEVSSPKNSVGMLTLTGAETDCSCLGLAAKAASGPKTTLATLYPKALASIGTGTLSAGSAGGGTLGTILAYDITGCFIKTTGGTGGGGTGGANNQARRIITYNTSTGAFTVEPNWETTPDNTTTYTILLPEGVTLGMLRALNPTTAGRTLDVDTSGAAEADVTKWLGTAAATPNTAGKPLVDLDLWRGSAPNALVNGRPGVNLQRIDDNATASDNLRDFALCMTTGAAAAGTLTTTAFTTNLTEATDDHYKEASVTFRSGVLAGQSRIISAYNGTTKVITVDEAFTDAPSATDAFIITPQHSHLLSAIATQVWANSSRTLSAAGVQAIWDALTSALTTVGSIGKLIVDRIDAAISSRAAAGDQMNLADGAITAAKIAAAAITAAKFAAGAIDAAALAADAGAEIADAVWDEAIAGHLAAGSTGAALNAAGSAGDPWTTPLPGAYGAGTAGFIIGTYLNAAISSRSSHSAADVWSVATRTLTAFGFSVTVGTNNDKTGYALSSAGIQAVWDALTSALSTAGSIGKLIVDNLNAAVSSRAVAGDLMGLSDGAITAAKIAAAAITAAKFAAGAIDAAALAADAASEIATAVGALTLAELSAVPGATPTIAQAQMLVYMALRNKLTETATAKTLHKDDGSALGSKATSDDGTTYTEAELA